MSGNIPYQVRNSIFVDGNRYVRDTRASTSPPIPTVPHNEADTSAWSPTSVYVSSPQPPQVPPKQARAQVVKPDALGISVDNSKLPWALKGRKGTAPTKLKLDTSICALNRGPKTPAIIITPSHVGTAMSASTVDRKASGKSQASSNNEPRSLSPPDSGKRLSRIFNPLSAIPFMRDVTSKKTAVVTTHAAHGDIRSAVAPTFEESGAVPASFPSICQLDRNNSIETVPPTPQRGNGWWNYITTPFLGRSNTGHTLRQRDLESNSATSSTDKIVLTTSPEPMGSIERDNKEVFFPEEPTRGTTSASNVGEAAGYYDQRNSFGEHDDLTKESSKDLQTSADPSPLREPTVPPEIPPRSPRRISHTPGTTGRVLAPVAEERLTHFTEETHGTPLSPSPRVEVASVGIIRTPRQIDQRDVPTATTVRPDPEPPAQHFATMSKPPDLPAADGERVLPADEKSQPTKEKGPALTTRLWNRWLESNPNQPAPEEKGEVKGKRRIPWLIIGITCALLAIILITLILVMTVEIVPANVPDIKASWYNVSGFPAIQTGILTVAGASAVSQQSGCVNPQEMWSCYLPSDVSETQAAGNGNSPNFRIQILYDGPPLLNATMSKRSPTAYSARYGRQINALKARGLPPLLSTSNPPPPSLDDQTFIGNTTDGNKAPVAGEITPFIISILPTSQLSSKLARRQDSAANLTQLRGDIPAPATELDGTAMPAALYPFPVGQPLMLYNRGQSNEHYGFYTYFDRFIYLNAPSVLNASTASTNPNTNGGVPLKEANAVCTWSQTRFLVQIWTRSGQKIPSASNSSTSAFDWTKPGSFGLPVTITVDRHGGDPGKKAVYCYGLEDGKVLSNAKAVHVEDRAWQGKIVNPAPGPFASVDLDKTGYSGVDGGSSGCKCQWTG